MSTHGGAHIKDSRGINDLALLIQDKHQQVHAANLMANGYFTPNETKSTLLD
ncbi:MAG: hypothetical protein QF552_13510 [Litorilituus sp.]|nr:hypothetical protein [Litorilituus sp.]